ncbi:pentalenene synthase [Streptomyces sp. NPDC059396]|uniref:terpene synthase family protein n=1 Tax=Streptomyces sp. NPDC059396 TaxID=3346819 RepID=UPI0036821E29
MQDNNTVSAAGGFPSENRPPGRIEFDIPFPPRMNPHLARANTHLISWLTDFDLLRSPEATEHFLSWRPAELPARWYPDAMADDLEFATDLLGWLMLLDDQFDGDVGHRPDAVTRILAPLTGVFDRRQGDCHAPPPGSSSAARNALADLWAREQTGMSTAWKERAARNWRDYLMSFVSEADNRRKGHVPDTAEYLALRNRTGIMYVLLDAAERTGRYEVPPPIYHSGPFQEMYGLTVLVAGIVNDLLGLEKEEARGDPHNLVLVLQHQWSCPRPQALARAVGMIREWTDRFLRLEARIPGVCDRLGIAPADRTDGYRLIADMRAAMRASYDWCAVSNRYSAESIALLSASGCLDDIVTAPPAR